MKVLILGFALAAAALAQQNRGSLGGIIRENGSGQPLIGAIVTVYIGDPQLRLNDIHDRATAISDEHGLYSFNNLPEGTLRALVTYLGNSFGGDTVVIHADRRETLNFRLRPAGSISGHVTDGEGHPVAGATVSVVNREYRFGSLRLSVPTARGPGEYMLASSVETNTRGEYKFAYVDPTRPLLLFAELRESNASSSSVLAAAFYPRSRDANGAVALKLRPGQNEESIDITLKRVSAYCIEAVLRNEGVPAPLRFELGAGDRSFALTPLNLRKGNAAKDGTLKLCGVPAGSYSLDAVGSAARGSTTFTVKNSGVGGIEVNAMPIRQVPTEFVLDDNRADAHPGSVSLMLRSLSGASTSMVNARVPETRTLSMLPDTEYEVAGSAPPGFHIQDVLFDGVSVYGKSFALHDERAPTLRVILGVGEGRLDATVTGSNEQPAGSVNVAAIPASALTDSEVSIRMGRAATDAYGHATIEHLAPGKYWVVAVEETLESLTPELIARLLQARTTHGEIVDVPGAGSVSVRLTASGSQ